MLIIAHSDNIQVSKVVKNLLYFKIYELFHGLQRDK